jgi:hypothetical protein
VPLPAARTTAANELMAISLIVDKTVHRAHSS